VSATGRRRFQGAPDEAGQTLTFQVTNNTNAALFLSWQSVRRNVHPLPANANGSATITINLKDNGGTASGIDTSPTQTFTITVNPSMTRQHL
jgi:hypothetical protein